MGRGERGECKNKKSMFRRHNLPPPFLPTDATPGPRGAHNTHPHATTMTSPSKRRELDITKLLLSDHDVELVDDNISEFYITFHGPKESACVVDGRVGVCGGGGAGGREGCGWAREWRVASAPFRSPPPAPHPCPRVPAGVGLVARLW